MIENARAKTHSKNPAVRLLCFVFSAAVYNSWVMANAMLARRHNVSAEEPLITQQQVKDALLFLAVLVDHRQVSKPPPIRIGVTTSGKTVYFSANVGRLRAAAGRRAGKARIARIDRLLSPHVMITRRPQTATRDLRGNRAGTIKRGAGTGRQVLIVKSSLDLCRGRGASIQYRAYTPGIHTGHTHRAYTPGIKRGIRQS